MKATGRWELTVMQLPRPFKGNYVATLIIAILAIAPFILVTTGQSMFSEDLAKIGVTKTAAQIVSGLAVAAYAFGAFLGGDLIQRFSQHALYWLCESLFIVGSLVAAFAQSAPMFGFGVVLLGFATGLLLVIALPPLVTTFGAEKMPITAAFVNIGFFGAVTLGPLVGGAVAYGHAWRWFYAGLALIGFIALTLSLFTLAPTQPKRPDQPFDTVAVILAFGATMLAFWGASELTGHSFASPVFIVPLTLGVLAFIALLLTQYHKKEPLAPIKPMWNTVPICGVLVAMFGGASLVTLMELLEQFELRVLHTAPLATGMYFWPEVLGTLLATLVLGMVVRTRLLLLLPLAGMLVLIAAGALMWFLTPSSSPAFVLAATGLLGLGAGSTVAPGLWVAAFSLPSQLVGRTFALVELVRSEADFIIAPVLVAVAVAIAGGTEVNATGIHVAIGIATMIAIVATFAVTIIYVSGGVGLPTPDLKAWLEKPDEKRPAIPSPEMGTALNQNRTLIDADAKEFERRFL